VRAVERRGRPGGHETADGREGRGAKIRWIGIGIAHGSPTQIHDWTTAAVDDGELHVDEIANGVAIRNDKSAGKDKRAHRWHGERVHWTATRVSTPNGAQSRLALWHSGDCTPVLVRIC
jgi:hypothetical protein